MHILIRIAGGLLIAYAVVTMLWNLALLLGAIWGSLMYPDGAGSHSGFLSIHSWPIEVGFILVSCVSKILLIFAGVRMLRRIDAKSVAEFTSVVAAIVAVPLNIILHIPFGHGFLGAIITYPIAIVVYLVLRFALGPIFKKMALGLI